MYITPPGSFLLPSACLLLLVSLWTPSSLATTTRSSLRIQSDYRSVLSLPDLEITQAPRYQSMNLSDNPAPHTQPQCPPTTAQAVRLSPRGGKSRFHSCCSPWLCRPMPPLPTGTPGTQQHSLGPCRRTSITLTTANQKTQEKRKQNLYLDTGEALSAQTATQKHSAQKIPFGLSSKDLDLMT